MATVRDVITSALAELGVIAAGETPSDADAQIGLSGLNDLVDQWAAERLAIYTITRTTWSIISGTQTYSVGAGEAVNIARPVFVDHVNFVDTSPSKPIEYQMTPLTDDAWSHVPIKTITAPFPTNWYYNPTFPFGALTLWPVPTASTLQGVLYAPQAVSEFASLDTAVSLPPGYRRMLIKNLALDLASAFERQPQATLAADARESKSVVKRANIRLMDMQIEAAALVQGRRYAYDINTGP